MRRPQSFAAFAVCTLLAQACAGDASSLGEAGSSAEPRRSGPSAAADGVAVPRRAPDEEPTALGWSRAIELAVRDNVAVQLARARTDEARGRALQAAAALLPRLTGAASQSRVFRENLAALGFTSGAFPPLLGPFNVFDLRAQLVLRIFDLGALRRSQAAGADETLAGLEERLAREQVAAAASLAYVDAARSREAIAAAEADDALALDLLALAQDRRRAGTATGIDAARAKTREAEEKLRLLGARTTAEEADLRLKHVLGIPLGAPVTLVDPLRFAAEAPPSPAEAADEALRDRLELRVDAERARREGLGRSAAASERLPTIQVSGDAGLSGNNPDAGARTTGSIGAGFAVPLFDGRRIRGEVREAEGRVGEAQAELDDARLQVEQDARLSARKLAIAADSVRTAEEALALARSEVDMARGRFSAGVGDNIELVDAQTALERTRAAQIEATAAYETARINLALAVGHMGEFKP